jgi:lipase
MTRAPRESRVCLRGIEIAAWEWPGEEPPVLLCHATGFHARIWDQVIAHLADRRCVAFDARGHGRSNKPAPPYAWREFGADVAVLAEFLRLTGAVGVGHSMGGHSATLAAALVPGAFSALLLLDPVIRAKDQYFGPWGKTAFVAKRRNQWASGQEMFERFENRPPFATWDRGVLRDYCEFALVPDGDGFVLACPPAVEASIYENSTAVETNIHTEIQTIRIPVQVVRSGLYPDTANVMGTSPTMPDLAASFARGSDTYLAEHSHFIPMEAPELTAKLISDTFALLK